MNAYAILLMLAVAAEPSDADQKKYEEAARNAINATASAIDACTGRYVEENPGVEGSAKISVKVGKDGVILSSVVETALQQARSLRECLERVGKSWRLPAPQTEKPDDVSLQIPVKKDAKFRIYAPGEQPPPEAADQPQGFLQFAPQFLRGYGEGTE